jgi:hypothetical protein
VGEEEAEREERERGPEARASRGVTHSESKKESSTSFDIKVVSLYEMFTKLTQIFDISAERWRNTRCLWKKSRSRENL